MKKQRRVSTSRVSPRNPRKSLPSTRKTPPPKLQSAREHELVAPTLRSKSHATEKAKQPLVVVVDGGFLYDCARRLSAESLNAKAIHEFANAALSALRRLDSTNVHWPTSVVPENVHVCISAPNFRDDKFEQFRKTLIGTGMNFNFTGGPSVFLRDVRTMLEPKDIDRLRLFLQRQDALEGYLIGRLSQDHSVMVISDSAGLAYTLSVVAARLKRPQLFVAPKSVMPRATLEVLEYNKADVLFIDSDAAGFTQTLFYTRPKSPATADLKPTV